MNDWQIVPRRNMVQGMKFKLHRPGKKLHIYLGVGLRKKIKGYKSNGWVGVYRRGKDLMIQLLSVPDENSRKMSNSTFSLPFSLVEKYWKDGARGIEIHVIIEKENLLLVDLQDLSR